MYAVLLTASVVMAQVNLLVVARLATEGGEQVDRQVSSSGMMISCTVEGSSTTLLNYTRQRSQKWGNMDGFIKSRFKALNVSSCSNKL